MFLGFTLIWLLLLYCDDYCSYSVEDTVLQFRRPVTTQRVTHVSRPVPKPSPSPIIDLHSGTNEWSNRTERLIFIQKTLDYLRKDRSTQCGTLFTDYLYQYQKKKMISWQQQKTVLAVPVQTGMSDRVVGIVTAFLLALLTDRYFVYSSRPDLRIDVLLECFDIPIIENITQIPSFISSEFLHHAGEKFNLIDPNQSTISYHIENLMYQLDYFRTIRQGNTAWLTAMIPEQAQILLFVGHLGLTQGIFHHPQYAKKLQDIYQLTPETTFGCLYDFIFQPKPLLFLHHFHEFRILTTARYHLPFLPSSSLTSPQPPPPPPPQQSSKEPSFNPSPSILIIGIHVRFGDKVLRGEKIPTIKHKTVHQYQGVFYCAQQIEDFVFATSNQSYTSAIWYLISDSIEFREYAINTYGIHKILTTRAIQMTHSGWAGAVSDGLYSAAAEWWLYSLSHYRITVTGGYSLSAASRLPYTGRIYRVDPLAAANQIHCGPKDAHTIEQMLEDFPGI